MMDEQSSRKFIEAVHELTETNERLYKQQYYWRAFLRGIAYGVGAALGGAVIIALLAGLLNQLTSFKILKPALDQVLPYFERQGERVLPQATYEVSPLPSPAQVFSPSPSLNSSQETE